MASLYSARHHRDIAALLALASDDAWLGGAVEGQAVEEVVRFFARHFQLDNSRFDKSRFLRAAGTVAGGER